MYMTTGEYVSKSKSACVCVWKQVMLDSYHGNGTSYNVNNLNRIQAKCFSCDGFNYQCAIYFPDL
jgi:hypothetical protein